MSRQQPIRLEDSDPVVGVLLRLEGREWTVTERLRFEEEEGTWANEWCCEADGTTAYLLKEFDEQKRVRWFFTREIAEDGVSLPDGETLGAWLQRTKGPRPPEVLKYSDRQYSYVESSEGNAELDSGERARKTVWEYWDDRRTTNLAVERWEDGEFECYLGAYIDPRHVTLRAAAEEGAHAHAGAGGGFFRRLAANPFVAALVSLPIFYLLAFIVGRPFDAAMSFALAAAAVTGWLFALGTAAAASGVALLLGLFAGAAFWFFPPLTSGFGLLALFGTPAVIALLGRRGAVPGRRTAIRYAAVVGVVGPLFAVGLFHYFGRAPGPHTPDQFALALGPAVLGGLSAWLLSGLLVRPSEEGAS
jgi:hypothetical protein